MKTQLAFSVKLITVLITLLCPTIVNSQNISLYTFNTGSTGSMEDMTSSTQLIGPNQTNLTSSVTNIGFDFLFVGKRYTQFSVNCNGVFRFGPTPVVSGGNTFDIAGNSRLVPFASTDADDYGNFATHSSGKVHYKMIGSAPNRILVVEWLNMEIVNGSGTADATFQLKIYESQPGSGSNSGRIEFVYGDMNVGAGQSITNGRTGMGTGSSSGEYLAINTSSHTSSTTDFSNSYASGVITDLDINVASSRYYQYNGASVAGSVDNVTASCISSNSVSLSWTDNVSNEAAFVIYKSTDNITYNYAAEVAANITDYVDTGLTPGTQYYYRVYPVTEAKYGSLSATGQLAVTTLASGNILQIASGNWSSPGTWSGGVVPTSADNVSIGCDGSYTLNIDAVGTCANLTINDGTLVNFSAGQQVTVTGDLSNAGTINMDGGTLNIEGDLVNESTGVINSGTASTLAFTGSTASQYTNNNTSVTKTWTSTTTTLVGIPDNNGNVATGNTVPSAAALTGCANCASVSVSFPTALGSYTALKSVYVDISHTYTSDLNLYLLSPDNTVFVLSTDNGGSSSAGYDNITFEDGGSTLPTTNGLTPDGTYAIEVGSLAAYAGVLEGTWTLFVADDANIDTGTITEFRVGIEETSGNIYYSNVEVNNSAGLTLNTPVFITNALLLTDGIINTSASNLLVLTDGAIASTGSASSFVDGPMRKIGNDNFVFPVGDGNVWARIGIASLTNTNFFTAEYVHAPYGDVTNVGTMNNVSHIEYWNLDHDFGSSSADVSLYFEDAGRSGVNDMTDLVVAHYTGGAWEDLNKTSYTGWSITTNGVSSFSPFTFGSNSPFVDPLPVALLAFNGKVTANGNLLTWQTASELNNKGFYIERSNNGLEWKEISFVEGYGTSHEMREYEFLDKNANYGLIYYRLRQVDYDGTHEMSHTISLESKDNIELLNIYPIPTSEKLTIDYYSKVDDKIEIEVFDVLGKPVLSARQRVSEGMNSLTLSISDLDKGFYVLKLVNRGIEQTQRIVKD